MVWQKHCKSILNIYEIINHIAKLQMMCCLDFLRLETFRQENRAWMLDKTKLHDDSLVAMTCTALRLEIMTFLPNCKQICCWCRKCLWIRDRTGEVMSSCFRPWFQLCPPLPICLWSRVPNWIFHVSKLAPRKGFMNYLLEFNKKTTYIQ